ncbi:M56 family metallopeptidase [Luteibacter sp. 3190]|uniref:M56 family metallopeptidase n=1 Tax=Luteibacter sp. 3190 TaxID=2817736 RepID=UPI0028585C3A|nr:M56 family metallopeptidase [Luteibacter sp. 3190]MDR6937344.1 beta-lactamase regulating signal transducer with metallopeptidase domain [Luteibacter sp. 3190]
MLAWMVYAVLVTMALGAAALMAEKAMASRRMPKRWPWMAAIAASVALPIGMATVSVPTPATPTRAASAIALRDTTSIPLASVAIDWSGASAYTASPSVNRAAIDIWAASSFTLVAFLSASALILQRRKRRWTTDQLCGVPVLVSDSAGPAVVGLVRSRIVVPAWVMRESVGQQRYVMAHEQSHLRARDPLLVAGALVLLSAMPWNPLLWWQFHRLRCAIEVDCDARVLRSGGQVQEYCETLIQVGQNQSEFIGSVTAMSESRSFLEHRIRIMLSQPGRWARATAFALISVALGMAVFATQVTPPATAVPATNGAIRISPDILDAYAGEYELGDYSLVTVARKGDDLTVTPIGQFMAQGTIDAPAISETSFAIPVLDARLEFTRGAGDRVEAMAVYIHGAMAATANRVDEARAEAIRAALAARIREQTPYPESEKALRLVLTNPPTDVGTRSGTPPKSAAQRESLSKYFDALGPVQSYRFNGVTDYGWDSYDVQHEHGAEQVFFLLDRDGLIVSSVVRRQ